MNENNISLNIETNSAELSQGETLTLLITIENSINESIHNVLLRNFIDPDFIKIDENELCITNNNFINLGIIKPNEVRTIKLNLSAVINYKASCTIHSLITYSAFKDGKSSSINIKSNELNLLLNPNCSDETYNNLAFINYDFTRSSEIVLEENQFSPYDTFDAFSNIKNDYISTLEPKLVGYNNSSEITKNVDNKNPQIGDIITFELFIKNVGNIDLKTIMYEEDFDSNLEFIKESLYINNMPYNGDVYYGVKINNFKINDELKISYKVKVLNISNHNLLSNPGVLTYSYISDRNITHKSIKVKCPMIKNFSQNNIINSNRPDSYSKGKEIFRNELNIATYSLQIVELCDLQNVAPKEIHNYQFKITNDGNMKCNSISLNIDLPDIFKYEKNSLCLNKNSIQIDTLDYEINLPGLEPNESIVIDFNFEPEVSLSKNSGNIKVYLTSSFKTYTNEIIQKDFSKDFKLIEVENNIIKELKIDSEYHIKNPEPSVNKVLNVESDAKIINCNEITPVRNRFNSNSMRQSNKRYSVKGVIKNKIQYVSNDNSIQTIVRQTPFNTILSSQDNFQGDISSLIIKCSDVSFKALNKKLVSITNYIYIH